MSHTCDLFEKYVFKIMVEKRFLAEVIENSTQKFFETLKDNGNESEIWVAGVNYSIDYLLRLEIGM